MFIRGGCETLCTPYVLVYVGKPLFLVICIDLARNCILNPKNPMQMQVAHDEQRHPPERTPSPDARCFCQVRF